MDDAEKPRRRDPESRAPYGVGNGPAPGLAGSDPRLVVLDDVRRVAVDFDDGQRIVVDRATPGPMPATLILGDGGHGKDAAGKILAAITGRPYASSSEFCAQKAVFPLVSDLYPDWRACYADRRRHRELWFHAIAAYNLRPGPMLAEQILADHGAYAGMRRRDEFTLSRGLFDLVLWVDRSEHVAPEAAGSMELSAADADLVLDNNGALDQLAAQICNILRAWRRVGGGVA